MKYTPLTLCDRVPHVQVPLLFLLLFILLRGVVHGQAYYANPGSSSFSQNWGTESSYRSQMAMLQRPATRHSTVTHDADRETNAAALPEKYSRSQPTVPGSRAVVRHGIAYAPERAPLNVKRSIWATNSLVRKPYHWGGGHGSFFDTGYDCSGTVSFALHYAGQISSPLDSHSLMSFGERGRGRWMTIYARNGHTFLVVAGLRLDTTGFYGDEGPRWREDSRLPWGFEARHPVGL